MEDGEAGKPERWMMGRAAQRGRGPSPRSNAGIKWAKNRKSVPPGRASTSLSIRNTRTHTLHSYVLVFTVINERVDVVFTSPFSLQVMVRLGSEQSLKIALSRDRQMMGGRFVEVWHFCLGWVRADLLTRFTV